MKKKILHIEENEAVANSIAIALDNAGYDVKTCSEGEDGLTQAVKSKPDLIITCISLPKKSGFDVIKILKSNAKTKNIPIMVLSAISLPKYIERAKNLGATEYLIKKDIKPKELVNYVNNTFKQGKNN